MTVRYSHEAWNGRICSWRTVMKLGRVVFVHGEQTQSRLLEKTHQSNGNLCKNNSVLMSKGEFKLAPNPNLVQQRCARVCGKPSMS